MDAFFRFFKRQDIPDLMPIECGAGRRRWSADDFERAFRAENGVVATLGGLPVGFLIYALQRNRIQILNMAVDEVYRRNGIGSGMLARLSTRLRPGGRTHLAVNVRETFLEGQLFLRDCGFLAGPGSVRRGYYPDTGEDAYSMRYDLKVALTQEEDSLEGSEDVGMVVGS